MSISDTVSVTVTVFDSAPVVSDFGTPLILATAPFVGEVREYNATPAGLSAMVTDGFTVHDAAYRKAQAICSQNPHCASFKVGPRDTGPNAQAYTLTPEYTTAGKRVLMTLEYAGTEYDVDVTIQSGDTAEDICDDIRTDLGTISGLTIGGTTTVTIALTTPAALRFYVKDVVGIEIADTSADAGVATDLAAAQAADSDWYGLLIDSTSPAEIAAAAVWAAANEKMLGTLSVDTDNATADDGVGYTVQQTTNHDTYVLATKDSYGHGEAGIMGRQFSKTPGQSTWAHKAITGQTADSWTASQFSALRANGCMTYVSDQGISHTYDGAACSGRFLDITRGIAWLRARVREAVLAQLVNVEKIPYTQVGIGMIEAAISSVLALAEKNGLLAGGWSVTAPALADISAVSRTARTLPNVSFAGVLQGAIHDVAISGTVVTATS